MVESKPKATLGTLKDGTVDEEHYADTARGIMERLSKEPDKQGKPFNGLTTTKLRGIYGYIMNVYTKVTKREDFDEHRGDIQYLKVRLAYESGREEAVREFVEETGLATLIAKVEDYDTFLLYCRYAESLVAYFKYFGGKD